jgi:hypothetical protein
MPAPLIGVSVWKYDIRFQTVRAVTVRGCSFRASATSRGSSTEHPQDRHNTRRTPVHREVRPSKPPPACSPRRVRARRRGQFGFKMRCESFDQPILGQLRSSVILVSKTRKTAFQIHHIALSANVLFRLTLPRIGLSRPRIARKVALARKRVQRRRPRVIGICFRPVAIKPGDKRFPLSRVRRSRRARHFGAPCLIS